MGKMVDGKKSGESLVEVDSWLVLSDEQMRNG